MAIPIVAEPDTWRGWVAEACCFCEVSTRLWTSLPDRKPGEQVACCTFCADTFDVEVVPTKDEWFDWHKGWSRAQEGQ